MSDEQFLSEVLRNPDDDAPRLVYADWLEEQGDPRGEFIRLQIQRSQLPVGSAQSMPLRAREQELLERHGREWAGSLAGFARSWQFSRGFVESVDLNLVRFLPTADRLFAAAPIRDLGLRDCRETHHHALSKSKHLSRLSGLRLSSCFLGDAALERLLASLRPARLETFAITETNFGRSFSQVLARSDLADDLRALHLSPSDPRRPHDVDVGRLLEAMPRLQFLDLSRVALDTQDARTIAAADLKHLLCLQIPGGMRLRSDHDEGHQEVGAEGIDAILGSPKASLKWFGLWFAEQAARLAGPITPELERLSLPRNPLSNADLTRLVHSERLAGLKYLDLRASRDLGADGLQEFLRSPLFGRLDCLRLSFERRFGKPVIESIVRAWKEQERPEGQLCLTTGLSRDELKQLRRTYGMHTFVASSDGIGDERLRMQMLMPGETSLDVLDGWKRDAG